MSRQAKRRAARRPPRREPREALPAAPDDDTPPAAAGAPERNDWAIGHTSELLLLAALVIAPYFGWIWNGFVYDDQVLIVARAVPASVSEIFSVFGEAHHPSGLPYYRPLSALTLSAQKAVWGDSAPAYHAFNVGLVLALALVVRAWLLERTGHRVVATAVAALLAVHPAVSSTVHAIAGRETLLVTVFAALACWLFQRPGRWALPAALLGFAAALFSKEQALVLPLVFLVSDLLGISADSPVHLRGAPAQVRAWAWAQRHVPVLLVLACYLLVRSRVLGGVVRSESLPVTLAVLSEPLGPLRSALYALQATFVPTVDLVYEPHVAAWWSPWRAALAGLAAAGLGYAAWQAARARRKDLLFWAAWAVVTLAPSANIVSQETRYDERYVVLPLVGLVAIAATVLVDLWERVERRGPLTAFAGGAFVAAALVSHHRGRFFENDLVFLSQWVRVNPTSSQAHASLAEHHLKHADLEKAVEHERLSVRMIHDEVPEPWCIKRHFALADVLTRTGRFQEAAAEYEEILRMKPGYSGARRKLEQVKRQAGSPPSRHTGSLDASVRERLVNGLRTQAAGQPSVWLAVTRADPRSVQLGDDLAAAFQEAGWNVRGRETVGFPIKPGLFLFAADPEPPTYVQELHQALTQHGLPVPSMATGYREYSTEMRAKNPAWNGFSLAPDQDFVLVVGRAGE